LILRNLIPLLYSNFEIYYNNKYYNEFDCTRNNINDGSFEHILNLNIEEVSTEDNLIRIHIKDN
jgi:hypothetical protein